jgi:hypothetical protein
MNKFLATFYTHYGAMKFNKACQELSLVSTLMPTPRKLSASCGICVEFEADSCEALLSLRHEDMESCYLSKGKGAYEKVDVSP